MHCQLNDDTPLGRNNHAFTGFSRPESRNSNHINADTRAYQVPLTTDLGLKVYAALDENEYQTKIKVTDAELAAVNVDRHSFHGDWNYTVCPPDSNRALIKS